MQAKDLQQILAIYRAGFWLHPARFHRDLTIEVHPFLLLV
jgi:hypothetical protein